MISRRTFSHIVQTRCPRCRKGNIFQTIGIYPLHKPFLMFTNCSNCKLRFELEDGFWTAALWISYPIVLVCTLLVLLSAYFWWKWSLLYAVLLTVFSLMALLIPFIRYSRVLLLYLFVQEQKGQA